MVGASGQTHNTLLTRVNNAVLRPVSPLTNDTVMSHHTRTTWPATDQ